MKQLKKTWLVQRLNKPSANKVAEVFAFGGGLKNGGLSEKAMSILRSIFSFDYMGSAEFEFGAIPKFFQAISKNAGLYSTWETEINGTVFFVIGTTALKSGINQIISDLSDKKVSLKEYSCVDVVCGKSMFVKKEDCRNIGWMDLDNEYMFFTDESAFKSTATLFGIKTDVKMKAVVYPHERRKCPVRAGVYDKIEYLRTDITKGWRGEENFIIGLTHNGHTYDIKHKKSFSYLNTHVSKPFSELEFKDEHYNTTVPIDLFLNITKKELDEITK